jgi:GNAT superfamily N-acetyltransferase
MNLTLRGPLASDEVMINAQLVAQGWGTRPGLYTRYLDMHNSGERDVIVAELDDTFAGYLTIAWHSDYGAFAKAVVPEIVDLNTLLRFQRRGVATAMMNEAERRIAQRATHAGIGVGLTADYMPALRMYLARGYTPDGNGLCSGGAMLAFGAQTTVDDALNLYFTKRV